MQGGTKQQLYSANLVACVHCQYVLTAEDWLGGRYQKKCECHPEPLDPWKVVSVVEHKLLYGRRFQCCGAIYATRISTSRISKYHYPLGCKRKVTKPKPSLSFMHMT
ncbi:hypothetical protein AAMO2058_000906000 [Amorphochlora amoebiformis]